MVQKFQFFQELRKHIENVNYEHLVILGDYNGTIDGELDRSNQKNKERKNQKDGTLPNSFFKIVKDQALVDI